MAAREFHGVIKNQWDEPIFWVADDCDSGEWRDLPSQAARTIQPGQEGLWSSESDGILTGTSGWSLWSIHVNPRNGTPHNEFIQVNWSVPFYGKPNITWAVFRSDPREFFRDPTPPDLEILITFWSQQGEEGALAQAAEIAPYVLTIPFGSFIWGNVSFITHPRLHFTVRERSRTSTQSSLTFPSVTPNRQGMAMQSFRHRAEIAAKTGFIGGFPNFYEATYGLDHVGGTIFVKSTVAEWRDVPLAELGNPPLDDFGERMRATNAYASRNGFVGGFPNFFHAEISEVISISGQRKRITVCGTVLLNSNGAEWRDVPLSELGNPALDDFEARFRATQDYATRNGFVGGFPNLFHAEITEVSITGQRKRITVCGTVLLKPDFAEWRDVLIFRGPA